MMPVATTMAIENIWPRSRQSSRSSFRSSVLIEASPLNVVDVRALFVVPALGDFAATHSDYAVTKRGNGRVMRDNRDSGVRGAIYMVENRQHRKLQNKAGSFTKKYVVKLLRMQIESF